MPRSTLSDEYLYAAINGFGTAVGVYLAYRLIMWARDGRPLGEYTAPHPPSETLDERAAEALDDGEGEDGE